VTASALPQPVCSVRSARRLDITLLPNYRIEGTARTPRHFFADAQLTLPTDEEAQKALACHRSREYPQTGGLDWLGPRQSMATPPAASVVVAPRVTVHPPAAARGASPAGDWLPLLVLQTGNSPRVRDGYIRWGTRGHPRTGSERPWVRWRLCYLADSMGCCLS
jgi:hypothetical protein